MANELRTHSILCISKPKQIYVCICMYMYIFSVFKPNKYLMTNRLKSINLFYSNWQRNIYFIVVKQILFIVERQILNDLYTMLISREKFYFIASKQSLFRYVLEHQMQLFFFFFEVKLNTCIEKSITFPFETKNKNRNLFIESKNETETETKHIDTRWQKYILLIEEKKNDNFIYLHKQIYIHINKYINVIQCGL